MSGESGIFLFIVLCVLGPIALLTGWLYYAVHHKKMTPKTSFVWLGVLMLGSLIALVFLGPVTYEIARDWLRSLSKN